MRSPPNYVDLAWSSYAAVWLSQIPRQSPDHFFIPYSTGAVRADFDRQAALEWEAFLSLRAAELRPGGRLVVALPSLFTDDGLTGFAPLAPLMDRSPVIRVRLRTCAALQPCACQKQESAHETEI